MSARTHTHHLLFTQTRVGCNEDGVIQQTHKARHIVGIYHITQANKPSISIRGTAAFKEECGTADHLTVSSFILRGFSQHERITNKPISARTNSFRTTFSFVTTASVSFLLRPGASHFLMRDWPGLSVTTLLSTRPENRALQHPARRSEALWPSYVLKWMQHVDMSLVCKIS